MWSTCKLIWKIIYCKFLNKGTFTNGLKNGYFKIEDKNNFYFEVYLLLKGFFVNG